MVSFGTKTEHLGSPFHTTMKQKTGFCWVLKINQRLNMLTYFKIFKFYMKILNTLFYLIRSDQISRSVVSDSLRPHESQHARPPCPSPTPRVQSDSRPSSQWCHPADPPLRIHQIKISGWSIARIQISVISNCSPGKHKPTQQNKLFAKKSRKATFT